MLPMKTYICTCKTLWIDTRFVRHQEIKTIRLDIRKTISYHSISRKEDCYSWSVWCGLLRFKPISTDQIFHKCKWRVFIPKVYMLWRRTNYTHQQKPSNGSNMQMWLYEGVQFHNAPQKPMFLCAFCGGLYLLQTTV